MNIKKRKQESRKSYEAVNEEAGVGEKENEEGIEYKKGIFWERLREDGKRKGKKKTLE